MDFTALRYFSETANSRSIRAASERLHVSPSAISRQIAKLEHELRAPIFDRRAQGMAVTPAGEILQEKFEGMMREFERVKSHIAALNNLQAGTVDVFSFQAAIEGLVAPVLHDCHVRYPNIAFHVLVSSTDEAIEALNSGAAEIGLVLNPPKRDTIVNTEVFRDTIVAVVAPTHRFARRKVVSLKELSGSSFVLTERAFGVRQQIDRVFDRHGFNPRVSCVTNSQALMTSLVKLNHQCALMPRFALAPEIAAKTLAAVPVREFMKDPLVFSICANNSRSLSPAAKLFVDAIVKYSRRYYR
jgi:DNA-binding transcriptional LysR family regulator